jgi:hypothetical protein
VAKKRLYEPDENAIKDVLDFLHFADIQVNELWVKREPVNINELPPPFAEFLKGNPQGKLAEQITYFFGHSYFDNEENVDTALISEDQESSGTQKLFAYGYNPMTSATLLTGQIGDTSAIYRVTLYQH